MDLTHGGDWMGFWEAHKRLPLDFSASTSPLPLPEGIRKAVIHSLDRAGRYPDPLCRELAEALGAAHGLPPSHILCGAGAADLLFRLALAKRPRRVLAPAPTFSGYEEALDCEIKRYFLPQGDGFPVTEEILSHITPDIDILFLCNPNNPTGRTAEQGLLRSILEKCALCGTLLALDECFLDFLDRPGQHTLTGKIGQFPNLLILRAFTKRYPMAGLRLGYALCSDTALLAEMRRKGQPWPVSTPAQAAGLAALGEEEYRKSLSRLIREQRPRLQSGLERLGCRVIPGEANFLLFFCPDTDLGRKLEGHGILLRDCSNFPGLGPGWYRAAVRTGEDNRALLRAMGEVL